MKDRITLICECGSHEHQVSFWYDEDDNQLYCEPHLVTHKGFFKRIWIGLKYAFGYKSRFGEWDCTIFSPDDLDKLDKYLKDR